MSARFAAVAMRQVGVAARALGWRPAEFWAATPIELASALGLTQSNGADAIDRETLQRMMDDDDG